MHFQYVPFIWPLALSATVTAALAVYALRHRAVRGALPFGICMLLTALWSAGYALEIAGADLETMMFWTKVQSMAYSFNPVIWLGMVFLFIDRENLITKRNVLLLLALPALTVAMAWTNGLYGLMWQNTSVDISVTFPVVAKTYGPWFWVIAAYSYILNIISELLLAMSLRRKASLYREQSLALFIGLLLLFIMNALYIFKVGPAFRYDLTPVVAGASGLIIAWGIFRYRLFDIVPVARENIIENMADGLIVLDAQNRIADMNRTAKTIFGDSSIRSIGQEAEAFYKNRPAFAGISCNETSQPRELVIQHEDSQKTYEVSYIPLQDRHGNSNGLTIILHDVTERRQVQARLLEQQKALAMLEERERLARDLHDNLGQIFGFVNIQAQAIEHELEEDRIESASQKVKRLVEVAQSAHGEMREYIRSVKITAAAQKNFVSALKQILEQFKNQTGINVKLLISDEQLIEALEPFVKMQMSNIVKEALNNIRKHAEAKQVSIEIKVDGNEILAVIEDDGRGFDVTNCKKEQAHGLGLNIMRERASEAGGEIRIDSTPVKGTRISLCLPYKGGERK